MPAQEKFLALYNDAKHRTMRKEHIYSNCIDQECTFQPQLITKNSKASQKAVSRVGAFLRSKSREGTTDEPSVELGEASNIIINHDDH